MARYRSILLAAVALVLLLPAAQRADAQDMLVIDSGGARWKSGENREPAVTVDFGVVHALVPDRRPTAPRRQVRKPRRYLTLNIPQPEAPPAAALTGRPPPPARPAAEPPPATAPAAMPLPKVETPPAQAEAVETPAQRETPQKEAPPARAEVPEPPAERVAPAASAPASLPAALPARRLPAEKPDATPALRAFLDRAAGKRPPAGISASAAAGDATQPGALPSARPAGAKLPPPPRPIQPRPAEAAAAEAAAPRPEAPAPFRLPPPAPATDAPAGAALSSASAVRLPPPPPATGAPGTRVLPPPAEPKAGASATLRRRLVLDAAYRTSGPAPASAQVYSETFFYKTGGSELGADERERLRNLAARLNEEEALGVEIRAYSGSGGGDGADARRQALSRAMEVRRLLIAAGVPDTRILARAAGKGEEPAGRVDIVLVRRS